MFRAWPAGTPWHTLSDGSTRLVERAQCAAPENASLQFCVNGVLPMVGN
jgi:hypothetical protein